MPQEEVFPQDEINLGEVYTYLEDQSVVEQRISITAEEIEKYAAEDLCSLLKNVGIQILSYGPYGLESKPSIRGFTDETVRVVIDGVCVNNPQYGTFDFSSISLNMVEKIEVVKGGFTEGVTDEGAVGGTIYITTKKQELQQELSTDTSVKTFFNINFPLDSFSQKVNYSTPVGDNSFFKAAASYTGAKNLFLYFDDSHKLCQRENAGVWDSDGTVSFTHFYGSGSSFTASDSIYGGVKNCPGTEGSSTYGVQTDIANRLSFSNMNPSVKGKWRIDTNGAWLSNTRFYDENSQNSKHFVNTLNLNSSVTYFGNECFRQSVGGAFQAVFLNSTNDGKHNQFSFTACSDTKIFFGDVWSITVPLAVKTQGSNFFFVPKIGVAADFDFGSFKAAAYRMVQFPNMDDLYWIGMTAHGNPDLLPEKGWGGEITFNSAMKFLPVSLTVFTNYYQQKIQWASDASNIWTPQNVASAFYAGVDVSARKNFFHDVLCLNFNMEYLYNRLLDKSNKYTYGKRIMWTPDFVASLSADVNMENWIFCVEGQFMGKRYISNLNGIYLKPYFLMNASASYTGFIHFTPYAKFDNMLFTSYESVDDYPMPLGSMTLGLRTKF